MSTENILAQDDRPRFFMIDGASDPGLAPPEPRHGLALRTYVRSLAGMQKEALVLSSAAPTAWRLVSDEGPYLAGYDEAPFPLAFMAAGMASSYFTETLALAEQRGIAVQELRLTVDNRYTMEGSALRGTMVGGAMPPEVRVEIDVGERGSRSNGDGVDLRSLGADAVNASPVAGLLRDRLISRFTLTRNGDALALGRVASLDGDSLPDPVDPFGQVSVAGPDDAARLMRRTAPATLHEGEGGKGSSLQAEQKRTLHVRATCTAQADGVKDIEVNLFKPTGSSFHFRSDEAGRAPDALTLVSAGVAFCFMTQFGRYAAITKKQLDGYRTIQDTHLSAGGASGGTGRAPVADPVETHVYLDTPEDDDFARTLVDMGEQTCFLHALCRTSLKPKLNVAWARRGRAGPLP
jgi:hypothetical protein